MKTSISTALIITGLLSPLAADQVISDDLIVTMSECIGMDCVNGENFGFDTLVLKENNLRIYFNDTSSSASFPNNDWRLVANDTSNGGANRFSIEDATSGRIPFTVEASAPSNALYVDDAGRLGLGTSNPVVDIHALNGNTPSLRLDQDGSSGFTPQAWDLAGNEANFFIRDVTNGSKLPFRIQPNTPENSISMKSDGKIGMGTNSPDSALHLRRTDGTAKLHIHEASATQTPRTLLELTNIGNPQTYWSNTGAGGGSWFVGMSAGNFNGVTVGNSFTFSQTGAAGVHQLAISPAGELSLRDSTNTEKFRVDSSGNVYGLSFNTTSDVNMKENFSAIDYDALLSKIESLQISTWNYKSDDANVRHVGPMAQDFYATFAIGNDKQHISALDAASIALAGIQALNHQLKAKDAEIALLKTKLETLNMVNARVELLEKMFNQLAMTKGLDDAVVLATPKE